jgi:predicted GIY-YIG superfamily endonuclease
MNCWYVYIIYCSSGKLYIGSTDNLERRYEEHRSGQGGHFTSYDRVISRTYSEIFDSRMKAELREKQLKKWSRAKKEALIAEDLNKLKSLSRRRK